MCAVYSSKARVARRRIVPCSLQESFHVPCMNRSMFPAGAGYICAHQQASPGMNLMPRMQQIRVRFNSSTIWANVFGLRKKSNAF